MSELRFAVVGAGFWARYQLAAWHELPGIRCVAICDLDRGKAEALARRFEIPKVYDQPEALFAGESLDFVDVIADPGSHAALVQQAAAHKVAVICQKPMAPTLAEAEHMVAVCREAMVPFFIHENWRWQTPLRRLKQVLAEGLIGRPFRARIDMISGFDLFTNQPFLKNLDQFILTDMGSHILDVARYLFGEARSLYCETHRVHPDVKGEDVATVVLKMNGGQTTVLCEMAYAENPLERECFPQTLAFIEGDQGSLELAPEYWVRLTTRTGTHSCRHPPPIYAWSDPAYALVHSSLVACQTDLLRALQGSGPAETTAEDNLKTMRLVFAAYDSAREGQAVSFP
jgi:predicted dehydrogenase